MSKLEEWGGLVAMLSGILGVLYFPFDASSFFAKKGEAEFSGVIPWSDAFRDFAEPLLTFGTPEEVHVTYARLGFFVTLGFAVGLVALHHRLGGLAGRVGSLGFYVSLVGMVLLASSVFAERWLGWGDWVFVALEVPAVLLLIPGLPVIGIATLRARVVPRLGAWLLAFTVPGTLLLTILTGHFSGGLLIPDLAWIVLGFALWSQRGLAPATP